MHTREATRSNAASWPRHNTRTCESKSPRQQVYLTLGGKLFQSENYADFHRKYENDIQEPFRSQLRSHTMSLLGQTDY